MLSILFMCFALSVQTLSAFVVNVCTHMGDFPISCPGPYGLHIQKAELYEARGIITSSDRLYIFTNRESTDKLENVRKLCEGEKGCVLNINDFILQYMPEIHPLLHVEYVCVVPEKKEIKIKDINKTVNENENEDEADIEIEIEIQREKKNKKDKDNEKQQEEDNEKEKEKEKVKSKEKVHENKHEKENKNKIEDEIEDEIENEDDIENDNEDEDENTNKDKINKDSITYYGSGYQPSTVINIYPSLSKLHHTNQAKKLNQISHKSYLSLNKHCDYSLERPCMPDPIEPSVFLTKIANKIINSYRIKEKDRQDVIQQEFQQNDYSRIKQYAEQVLNYYLQ